MPNRDCTEYNDCATTMNFSLLLEHSADFAPEIERIKYWKINIFRSMSKLKLCAIGSKANGKLSFGRNEKVDRTFGKMCSTK